MTGIAGRSSFEWLLGNFLANKSHLKVMSPIWYKESNAISIGLGLSLLCAITDLPDLHVGYLTKQHHRVRRFSDSHNSLR